MKQAVTSKSLCLPLLLVRGRVKCFLFRVSDFSNDSKPLNSLLPFIQYFTVGPLYRISTPFLDELLRCFISELELSTVCPHHLSSYYIYFYHHFPFVLNSLNVSFFSSLLSIRTSSSEECEPLRLCSQHLIKILHGPVRCGRLGG